MFYLGLLLSLRWIISWIFQIYCINFIWIQIIMVCIIIISIQCCIRNLLKLRWVFLFVNFTKKFETCMHVSNWVRLLYLIFILALYNSFILFYLFWQSWVLIKIRTLWKTNNTSLSPYISVITLWYNIIYLFLINTIFRSISF